MGVVSRSYVAAVDEGDADSHPRCISIQHIQPRSTGVAVSLASTCKRRRKPLTGSYLMYSLRTNDLCNIGEYQAKDFGQLK